MKAHQMRASGAIFIQSLVQQVSQPPPPASGRDTKVGRGVENFRVGKVRLSYLVRGCRHFGCRQLSQNQASYVSNQGCVFGFLGLSWKWGQYHELSVINQVLEILNWSLKGLVVWLPVPVTREDSQTSYRWQGGCL